MIITTKKTNKLGKKTKSQVTKLLKANNSFMKSIQFAPVFVFLLHTQAQKTILWTPKTHEKWKCLALTIWVITLKNEGTVGSYGFHEYGTQWHVLILPFPCLPPPKKNNKAAPIASITWNCRPRSCWSRAWHEHNLLISDGRYVSWEL